jgi:hypothetical protein
MTNVIEITWGVENVKDYMKISAIYLSTQDIKDDIVVDKSSILEDYELKLDLPFDEISDNKEATTDKENKCKECGACFQLKVIHFL